MSPDYVLVALVLGVLLLWTLGTWAFSRPFNQPRNEDRDRDNA